MTFENDPNFEMTDEEYYREWEEHENKKNEPATLADFWLPEHEGEILDPRLLLRQALIDLNVDIEPAIEVENPNCPPSFLGISSGWYHTILHGKQTKETFEDDLRGAVSVFADMIAKQYNPLQPIRFYREAVASYGISPYTFAGREFPFDLRLIGMVERSIAVPVEGEMPTYAAGLKWYLSTMIVPDPDRDANVHVGYDYGNQYDG